MTLDPDHRFTTSECAERLEVATRQLAHRVSADHRWARWLGVRQGDTGSGNRRTWAARDLVVMAYLSDVALGGPAWHRSDLIDALRCTTWGTEELVALDGPFTLTYRPRWSIAEPAPTPQDGAA